MSKALNDAIERYVLARIADNEKGGGDPESYAEIECELNEARVALETQLLVKRMVPVTQEKKAELSECVKELLGGIPKRRQAEYLGAANELWLLIGAVPVE